MPADRQPSKGMGGPIPDFGQYTDFTDSLGLFVENLLKQIKDWTGIDLYWMLDWSWTTNTIMQLVAQANDLFAWLQNPIQRPPNLLTRPSFSSPSAIAEAPDWSWDPVISLGTVTGPGGVPRTDPQGSARTIADGSMHSMLSNAISERSALTPGQILTCQIHALVEAGFTAADDQAIRLELVPSRLGVLQEPVVLASCGVPTDDPEGWIAAPDDAKSVFFDVDYTVPVDDSPDTVELRLVVSESAGGNVPVRFDGARVAAAGGFLVVLADLFDAGRIYLTDLWDAVTAWLEDVFDADNWTALKTDTDAAFDVFVRRVKRALHHADADIFHPPATSDILSNALRANPWFGWLFDMVDSWLQPVLLIGKAGTAFWETVWHAVTAFAAAPTASGAWSTLMSAINGAWNTFVDAILEAWGSTKTHADFASPGTATTAALKNNEWFGWLFDLVDTWLQPVLKVGKAVTDFGDALWHAVTAYAANPLASGAWPALVNALNDAWNGAVDAILNAWGSPKTHADFASPAEATEKVIKNNPVTGWLFGNTFEGGSWLDNALAPITNFFDSIRKYINQMVEPLHWGYFDTNWAWVPALTTPDTQLPGDGPVMTPGSNDGDGGGIAPGADTSIPSAPKNVSAIPFWDITVSGFPAGNITYAIAAVKSGVEGPATQVKTYVSTMFPPNSSTHVDLRWDAVSGASSYRVYRKADGYSTTTAWRLVASPTSAGTLLSPVVDKTARTGGTVAAPKTDAELAASIVSSVKSTATTAASTASAASSAASAAQSATQQISDQIQQAVTGSPSSGAPISGISDALSQIPQNNIIPVVTHEGNSVTLDAISFAPQNNGQPQNSPASHTLGADANYMTVAVMVSTNSSSSPSVTVNFAGTPVAMDSLANIYLGSYDASHFGHLVLLGRYLTTESGTLSITCTVPDSNNFAFAVKSFVGVSSVSSAQTVVTTGSTGLTQSVSGVYGGAMVSQAFGLCSFTTSLSAYNGDNSTNFTYGYARIAAGTKSGNNPSVFSAAIGNSSPSGAVAVVLTPSDVGQAGSGAVLARNVGSNRSISANGMFPSDYYPSKQFTPDIDITSSGGVEVTMDGWYLARVAFTATGTGTTRPVLYRNGSVYRTGPAQAGTVAHTFIVYLNVGDVINPGCTDAFTATASADNVFEVALMSRSLL
ncbi:hypothetical protein [Mycolicibacter heraklionensis]|uniref:hypothetical protein n=1 Tax=Mycolicibacter heraklionensis TaxID=512402 RepID=UPI001042050D|nr:hypothetical protein [Mycolicibacter heraklionensis]